MNNYDALKSFDDLEPEDFGYEEDGDDRNEDLAAKGEERWESEVEDNI